MNSAYMSNKVLIELLKKFGIKKLVLSSGCRNIPFVMSVETDKDFECFSVIDERNAAFFAIGLYQQSNEPIAIACTSGTAASNYVTGITEAYYTKAPIVVLTFDRNPYMYNQLETQKIDQMSIFNNITNKNVLLPVIKDEDDLWYCNRLINEALIEVNKKGKGPVHINIPLIGDLNALYNGVREDNQCENIAIKYISNNLENGDWKEFGKKLFETKKVLFVAGQSNPKNEEEYKIIKEFFDLTQYPLIADNLANFKCDEMILAGPTIKALNSKSIEPLVPDIVITYGNNFQERIKDLLRANRNKIEHWSISPDGEVHDCFKCETVLFECSEKEFFKYYLEQFKTEKRDNHQNIEYIENWKKIYNAIKLPEMPFTNFLVAREFSKAIPLKSTLHLSILNATRQMQFFNLDKSIKVFSNVNSFGIDGCLPTFMGQAYLTDELAFIIIGDLSFFYGMNALGIKHVKNNVRVLLINNGGGAEFHIQPSSNSIPTIDLHIGAAHNREAKGWAESLGYEYLRADNEEKLKEALERFVSKDSERPMLLEVKTNMKKDGEFCLEMYRSIEKDIKPILDKMGSK